MVCDQHFRVGLNPMDWHFPDSVAAGFALCYFRHLLPALHAESGDSLANPLCRIDLVAPTR
jgi:hypothetical protein